jgi:dihydrofolate reductase
MRLVATEYLSLDGVFEEPGHWSGPYFTDEAAEFKWNELQTSDALLLGRVTYEGFAAAWPTFSDEVGFADKMNGMPKYVVSSTMDKADWSGSQVLRGDLVEQVRALKGMPGQDLLLAGSAQVFNALHAANLIDRYRFLLHPVILGQGRHLFAEGAPGVEGVQGAGFTRVHTAMFGSGIILAEYEPAAM